MRTFKREALSQLSRASVGGLVTVEKAAVALGIPSSKSSAMLTRLARAGWVRRVRRGLYLMLPLQAHADRPTTIEDPWILALERFSPCYIGGWSAAEYWGLTEQIFRSTFVATSANVRAKEEQLLGQVFHLARIPHGRVGGVTMVWRGQHRAPVSGKERTIADALLCPRWVGGVRHLADMLLRYRQTEECSPSRLLVEVERLNRGAAFKRFGYLVETMFPEARDIVKAALARRSAGVIKLDPAVSSRGKMNKRWGLWVNVNLQEHLAP